MIIEWNKVTWYSKLLAVIVFLATFVVAFNFGRQYEKIYLSQPSVKVYTVPNDVVLSVNESAKIGDLVLTLNSVQNDYRCPIDVQCIQAGAINTNVTFEVSGNTITKNMPSDEVPQEFEKYKISIVEMNPPAHSKTRIEQKDYRITFRITK